MLDNQNKNLLEDPDLSVEELLGPPKVDLMGFGLMLIMSLVVGFLAGVATLLLAYLTSGQFSMQSGVSPILLALVTFLCLTFANYLYTWGLSIIFPHIYTRARTMFIQISAFSIILYITMAGLYLIISMIYISTAAILGAFAFHVVFNVFGLLLLTGIIAHYRYSLLMFYADFIALILTGLIVFWTYSSLSESGSALFILMGLVAITFFLSTFINFGVLWIYFQMYRSSGFDPIGNVFSGIENDEKNLEKEAEKMLLTKR